jgi:hypothetical protein
MAIQDEITQAWVKITGRKIDPIKHEWLIGPIGHKDVIKDNFISILAENEGLEIQRNTQQAGLLENIEDIGISGHDIARLNNQVKDFYENTSDYDFEVWSEWTGLFKAFGWLLSIIFSRRLQQLNLPLSSMDLSQGIQSEIIKLKEANSGKTKWTIWYRTIRKTNKVIYSGVYTTCKNPKYQNPLLKVVFPLPNGNASVVMTKEVQPDGSLLLRSNGQHFGDNGFYFTLTDQKGQYWARFVKSMHEWIRVYEDEHQVLRADHCLSFYGLRFLNLHYKMLRK